MWIVEVKENHNCSGATCLIDVLASSPTGIGPGNPKKMLWAIWAEQNELYAQLLLRPASRERNKMQCTEAIG